MFRYFNIWGWYVRCHITNSLFGMFISGGNWLVETVLPQVLRLHDDFCCPDSWWAYRKHLCIYIFKNLLFSHFRLGSPFWILQNYVILQGWDYMYMYSPGWPKSWAWYLSSFLLVFISPELIWAENLMSPLGLGLQWLLGTWQSTESHLWGQIVGLGNNCIMWGRA